MSVDEANALPPERNGEVFYFCSESSRSRFLAEDNAAGTSRREGVQTKGDIPIPHGSGAKGYEARGQPEGAADHDHFHSPLKHPEQQTEGRPLPSAKYFCPMHPEVTSDEPGTDELSDVSDLSRAEKSRGAVGKSLSRPKALP
jgi:YHS domain-containing protein